MEQVRRSGFTAATQVLTPPHLTLSGDGEIINATEGFGIFPSRGQQAGGGGKRPLDGEGSRRASAGYDGIRVNGDLTLEVKGNASWIPPEDLQ